MSLGERIKARRLDHGWKQRQLADKAGISHGFLSDLENGKRRIGADLLLEIADALDCSVDFLMKGAEPSDVERIEIEIPAKLAQFASEAGLTFRQTLALLRMNQQIIAHRAVGQSGARDVDWKRFYDSVKEFLE